MKGLSGESRERPREALRKGLAEIRARVGREAPPLKVKGGGAVEVGGDVRVLSLGVRGKVEGLAAGDGMAEVVCGGVRMKVPTRDLIPVKEKEEGPALKAGAGGVSYNGTMGTLPEIRLLGKKVPDALDSMERFLDRSVMGTFQTLRIIHGGGTGALKKAVREALRKDPRVSSFGPAPLGEGGEGVTVVHLKE